MDFLILIATILSFECRSILGEIIEVSARNLENAYVASVLSSEDGKVFQLPDEPQHVDRHYAKVLKKIEDILKKNARYDNLYCYQGDHRIFADYEYLLGKHKGEDVYPRYLVNRDQMDVDLEHVDQRATVRLRGSEMLVTFSDPVERQERAFKIAPYSNGYLLFGLEEGFHKFAAKIVAFVDTRSETIYHVKRLKETATTAKQLIEMWDRYAENKVIDEGGYTRDLDYIRKNNEYYTGIFNRVKNVISREKKLGGNFPLGPKSPTPSKVQKNSIKSWIPAISSFHRGSTKPKIIEVSPESVEYAFLATVIRSKGERDFQQYMHQYDDNTFKEESRNILNILLKHTDQGVRDLGRYGGDRRIFGDYDLLRGERRKVKYGLIIHSTEDAAPRPSTCVTLEHVEPNALSVMLTMTILFFHEYEVALKVLPYENGYLLFRWQYDVWKAKDSHSYCARIVAFVNTQDGNIYQVNKIKGRITMTPQELNEKWKKYATDKNSLKGAGERESYLRNIFRQVENYMVSANQAPKKSNEKVREFPLHILRKSGTSTDSALVKDPGSQKKTKSRIIRSCFHEGSSSSMNQRNETSEGKSTKK